MGIFGKNNKIKDLIKACKKGRLEIVKNLLSEGVNPNGEGKYIPLLYASENGYRAIVELLLEKGANVNSQDKYGDSALLWAVNHKHTNVVKLLLDKGADVNIKNKGGTCALEYCVYGEIDVDLIKLLLDKGANVNSCNKKGETPLFWATLFQKEEIVRLLLRAGADPGAKTNSGFLGFDMAIKKFFQCSNSDERGRQFAIVKLLIDYLPQGSSKEELLKRLDEELRPMLYS